MSVGLLPATGEGEGLSMSSWRGAIALGSISMGPTDFVSGVPATGRTSERRQGQQLESD